MFWLGQENTLFELKLKFERIQAFPSINEFPKTCNSAPGCLMLIPTHDVSITEKVGLVKTKFDP